MSSTGRPGVERKEADFYATPPYCVDRILERLIEEDGGLKGGRWLEPCAGDGELVRAVNSFPHGLEVRWSLGELRREMSPYLEPLADDKLIIGDFLDTPFECWGPNPGKSASPHPYWQPKPFEVCITNPPFGLAIDFIEECIQLADTTVMLLRLNFWGSEIRKKFMKAYPPDTYVLPNRPVFSLNKHGKPGTDSPEYAWFVWKGKDFYDYHRPRSGRIEVLNSTPVEQRKAWTVQIKARAAL